jgi:hypothetical protein
MPSKHTVSTILAETHYLQLKEAADTLCDGNISEMTRRLVVNSLDDYVMLRRTGVFRMIFLWRQLTTRRHRGMRHIPLS